MNRTFKNKLFKFAVITFTIITVIPLLLIIYKLVVEGINQININFFIEVAPNTLEAMVAVTNNQTIPGGIANGITGTFIIVVLASLIAIPIGVLTGIYLFENKNRKLRRN